jgi:hypothetical protein
MIHIRVRFNISSSCCSVVGVFGGRRCRFKSVAILTSWGPRLSPPNSGCTSKKTCAPNGKTRVQPATIFFPAACRHRIDAQENICLAEFDGFPAIDQCICCGALCKVHGDRVHFAFLRIAQCNRAHYIRHISRQHGIIAPKKDKSNRPTVNKNGHREKVSAGVCNLGSSTEMNGYKDNPTGQRLLRCAHASTRTFIRV